MTEPDNKALRRPALGRGLAALIPQAASVAPAGATAGILQIPIERVQPERQQPRQRFDGGRLDELAASIREKGILQPILVRRSGASYRIVAGERRWRAAQRAGLHEVPAIVKDLGDHDAFEAALIENLQREDLDPLEEAEAYRRLVDEHGLTQEQAAARVGKDRSTVANALRLLKLPEEIRKAVTEGTLDMGHARALLGVADEGRMLALGREAIEKKLSVREVERLVRGSRAKGTSGADGGASASLRHEEEALARALGTRVRIEARGERGAIVLPFSGQAEFARLVDLLQRKAK